MTQQSGISSGKVSTRDNSCSLELVPSLWGSVVCPSVSCCIHVLGLHVAVMVGHEGDPSGRLILGLLVPISSTSNDTGGIVVEVVVATVVFGTSGTSIFSLSWASTEVTWFPPDTFLFL